MISTQFDASLLRAMQLLHSPNKEATEQLKAIFDESLAQKKAPIIAPAQKSGGPIVKPVIINKQPGPKPTSIISATDDLGLSSCVVCKRAEQKAGNEIVECQECHEFYHRECHRPGLETENFKDPRFVWYCSTCRDQRKKIKMPPPKQPPSLTGGTSASKEPKESQNPGSSPFKSWSFMKK